MTSITLNQHRVMDVRVNQSRSGVGMLPWVSECSEHNPGITSLISSAREAGDRILRSFRAKGPLAHRLVRPAEPSRLGAIEVGELRAAQTDSKIVLRRRPALL